jgi:hypothetical protein
MSVRFTYGKRRPFQIGTASKTVAMRRHALVARVENMLVEPHTSQPFVTYVVGATSQWKNKRTGLVCKVMVSANDGAVILTPPDGSYARMMERSELEQDYVVTI